MRIVCALFLAALSAAAIDKKAIVPAGGPPPVGPYTPGIMAGEFLYVSGQGARGPDGTIPSTFEEQATNCLNNVRKIVEAAGLTMEHIVYTQIYFKDISNYPKLDPILLKYFPRNPPARATLGVYRMPTETPIEINAVAVRDLSRKKPVIPPGYKHGGAIVPGVKVGDRLYISGFLGRDPASGSIPTDPAAQVQLALDRFKTVLTAAGMDFRHVVFVNPYLTKAMPMGVMNKVYAKHFEFGNTPARATIVVNELPMGANIAFTGVAVGDLSKRKAVRPKNMSPSATASPCVWVEDTYYCSAKSGFIPGPNGGIYAETVDNQVRQTMRNLLDGLEEADLDFSNVVASNVYVDNLDEFSRMNAVYGSYFKTIPPTRTTVAPLPPVERKQGERGTWPKLEEISIIAVK
jgi:2-iminobutanoate/2-iminopropanoate deaminase